MRKWIAAAAAAFAIAMPAAGQGTAADVELWRLDCGNFVMKKFGAWFSDTFQYPPGSRNLVGSCYLIRHGSDYMLWDTGMRAELIGKPYDDAEQTMSLKRSLVDQLREIEVTPDKIRIVGISHYHSDHTGQAGHFPNAKLVIGAGDAAALRSAQAPGGSNPKDLAHWLGGTERLVEARGDIDIFHDGRVIMLAMPGHTPGHSALLVRLASGPVLLSGDQYHFTEAVRNRGVPSFNTDRADTLASHDRFDRIAANLRAKVIIQHEPADVAKLPAFPQAAE